MIFRSTKIIQISMKLVDLIKAKLEKDLLEKLDGIDESLLMKKLIQLI